MPSKKKSAYKQKYRPSERELLDKFMAAGHLPGRFVPEVFVMWERFGERRIDALCVSNGAVVDEVGGKHSLEDLLDGRVPELGKVSNRWLIDHLQWGSVWIIEIKRKLNPEVIGQVLTDEYVFKTRYYNLKVEGVGIICEDVDDLVRAVAKDQGISIWVFDTEQGNPRWVKL